MAFIHAVVAFAYELQTPKYGITHYGFIRKLLGLKVPTVQDTLYLT